MREYLRMLLELDGYKLVKLGENMHLVRFGEYQTMIYEFADEAWKEAIQHAVPDIYQYFYNLLLGLARKDFSVRVIPERKVFHAKSGSIEVYSDILGVAIVRLAYLVRRNSNGDHEV